MLEKTDYFPDGQDSKEELFAKLYRSYESAPGEGRNYSFSLVFFFIFVIVDVWFLVLGETIKTIGVLLERYPDVTNDPYSLYRSIFMKLKNNITKKSDSPVTECFAFISAFVAVHTVDNIDNVYKCIKERLSVNSYRKMSHRGNCSNSITIYSSPLLFLMKNIY